MQSNNNITGEAMIGLAVLVVIFWVIKIVVIIALSVAIVLAGILTILSLCAWNKPFAFAGETISPEDARTFIGGGLLGFGGTILVGLVANALGLGVSENAIYLGAVVAYLGAGLESLGDLAKAQAAREETERADMRQIQLPPPSPTPQGPFPFACWDDEEERR
jgi:putative flippase GtrA